MRRGLLFVFYRPVQHCKTSFQRFSTAAVPQITSVEKCCLVETQGRPWKLLLSPADTALAHCVSSDFQMDNGIAKEFLKKYGNVDELKEKGLVFPEGRKVGKIGVLEMKERFVYYLIYGKDMNTIPIYNEGTEYMKMAMQCLITRDRWWDPASYMAMEHSLHALQAHCDEHGVQKLAIPRLGAQHDRLEWNKVKDLILDIFKDSSITITAYTHR